jgi:conjugative transfer signal peptidase TraF
MNSRAKPQSITMTRGLFNDRSSRSVAAKRVLLTGTVLLIGTLQIFDLAGLRINTSPSLPVGLYQTTSNPAATLVEFCPGSALGVLALERGYRSAGSCGDGGAPLLKPVVAKWGDVVDVSQDGLAVNGRSVANTAPMAADIKGRHLVSWPSGHYVVSRGEVWVASSFNPRSFDSRYFGPVPVSAIHDHLRPLITFGK